MQTQSKNVGLMSGKYALRSVSTDGRNYPISDHFEKIMDHKDFLSENNLAVLDALLSRLVRPVAKTSFLVFSKHKYITVPIENIAFFYIRYESATIMCFDMREYPVNYSLEQIQNLLTVNQFFRLNRQYLINFNAVKEVEHYFARKLLVNLTVPVSEKLLVTKEKVTSFLNWLENR
ncbi:LytR/AlgR family response regulator transcription factor [Flavitalea antarctica]